MCVGLRLSTQCLELLGALGLLRLTGLDEPLIVDELASQLLAQSDELVAEADRVLVLDAGNDSHDVLPRFRMCVDCRMCARKSCKQSTQQVPRHLWPPHSLRR